MSDLDNLKAFLEAASMGSFVAASERLHLSHSSVSARVRALEQEIGAKLFNRGRHGVTLNEAGKNLLPIAEHITQTWMQAKLSTKAIAVGHVPVRVGVQQDLWDAFGAAWFADIKTQVPELQLHLTADTSTRLCQQISQQLLDLALIFEPRRTYGVTLKPVAELTLRLTSKSQTEWTGQLASDYFYVDWGQAFENWHNSQFGQTVSSAFFVEVAGIALSVLNQNGGVAYFPEDMVAPLVKLGEVNYVENAPACMVTMNLAGQQGNISPLFFEQAVASLLKTVKEKQMATPK
jgi:DNA-binding transcriptional LysR family regulator